MFDWLTTRAVADELRTQIVNGRVQAVSVLDSLAFGLEIYSHHARQYLFASADPVEARVHLVVEKLRSAQAPSPFVLLLRKYVGGALVNRIHQPEYERIIEIEFDHPEYGVTTLVIEVMGRHSNILLLDAGRVILDAIKRVSPDQSRVRPIQPKRIYNRPPLQKKLRPDEFTTAPIPNAGDPDWLVRNVAGTSPLFAREIVHRSHGQGSKLPDLLRELGTAPPAPSLAYQNGEIVACAPYRLTQFVDTRAVESISAALEAYYGRTEAYAAVKEPLRQALNDAHEKLTRKRENLERQRVSPDEIERLRTTGEMILAFAHEIKPGQRELRADWGDGLTRKIALEPRLNPAANARRYFGEYQRAKRAAGKIPAQMEETRNQLGYVEQMLADLEMAETRAEIEEVILEASEAGFYRTTRTKSKPSALAIAPREFVSRDGFKILVGRNAKQNDTLTFRMASGDDLWLHARTAGGAHVVIIAGGREIPQTTIEQAASLAAYYSQARNDSQVDVALTLRRNVRKPRRAPPGLVTVREEKTVRVVPKGSPPE